MAVATAYFDPSLFQPRDPTLTALAGVTTAANKIIYATGADAFDVTDFTAAARTFTALTPAAGDLLYASGAGTWSRLADVAVGNVLLSGGVGVAPAYGKVDLASHVAGLLQAANFPALTGDVTTVSGALATTITNGAVTNAKIANATIDLTTKVTGDLPFANLAQVAALSIAGNATNATADMSAIAFGTDGGVLQRSGTGLVTDNSAAVIWTARHTFRTGASSGQTPIGSVVLDSTTEQWLEFLSPNNFADLSGIRFSDETGAAGAMYYRHSTNTLSLIANQGAGQLALESAGVTISPSCFLDNAGLKLLDTNSSHYLTISPGSNITAARTLTLATGDADRTVTLNGNPTLDDWFDQSVKVAATPTWTGAHRFNGGIGVGQAPVADRILQTSASATLCKFSSSLANAGFLQLSVSASGEPLWTVGSTSALKFMYFETSGTKFLQLGQNFADGANLASTGSLQLVIDSNNDTTTAILEVAKDSATGRAGTDGTPLFRVRESANIELNGGATSPVLQAGAADTIALAGVDNGAGSRELYVRNEAGKAEQLSGTKDRVSAQLNKTDTTLAAITGLSHNVEAGKAYAFRAVLFYDANAVGGHKYSMHGTCTATSLKMHVVSVSDATNTLVVTSRQTALDNTTGVGQAGSTAGTTYLEGLIVVNAAGTLTPMFAQNSASGTSSILAGSYFEVIPIGD